MRKTLKISDILLVLEKELSRKQKAITPIGPKSRQSKKRAYTLLLIENYTEVVLILRRILSTLTRLDQLHKLIFPTQPHDQCQDQSQIQAWANEQFKLVTFLPLDMKCLYLWTAQITDILKKSGANIDLQELRRISLFRHNFITHVHETSFFQNSVSTRAGTKFHTANEEVEVMFHPFSYSKRRFSGFKSLVKKAAQYIPDLAAEQNVWEQLYILYRQINKVSDRKLQRNLTEAIFRIGNATEPPGLIAQALLMALKNYR